jgi:DinB superfamily
MSQEIIPQLENALEQTISLLGSLSEEQLNTVPFEGSWTAAQVGRHLFKSETGTDNLLKTTTQVPDRDPAAGVQKFADIFLNFESKMKSPDYIVPEDKKYDKGRLVASLEEVKDTIIPAAKSTNLNETAPLPEGHPFAGSTKLEIMHFMAYHTIRHNRQIEKIKKALT